jgi:5-methylthioadenosine/S-adenosylhomocysteine deaminase
MSTPQRGAYLLKGAALVSMDEQVGDHRQIDILLRHGGIEQVAPDLVAPDADQIDARGMIAMPGLIDSHFHMWSSIGRNFIADGYEYFPAKWATAAHYSPDDFYASVLLGLVECINAGITTVHNWSHNTRTPDHADAELRAHRDGFVRARYSYGHRDGLPGDAPLDFTDIDRVADEWFGASSPFDGLVGLGVNLRGPDLGEDRIFVTEMEQALERGLPVAIHTVQGAKSAVSGPRLEEHGYLGPDFLVAHFLAATEEDRRALARNGSPLSYAVHSELRLGEAGDAREALLRMLSAGVTVSFSIDATSIAPVNLFEAMSIAWNMGIPWQGSPTAGLPPVTMRQCLEMATINGARALGLDSVTGSITPGKRADLILVRAGHVNVAPAVELESTLVRSTTPANVDTVFIDGALVKRGGRLVAHDVEAVVARAEEASQAVRARSAGRLRPAAPAR